LHFPSGQITLLEHRRGTASGELHFAEAQRRFAALPYTSWKGLARMSMDPTKWITFDKLTQPTRQRIETIYPYLKVEQCLFQEKPSGTFMKQANSVKIEKLLDATQRSMPRPPPPPPAPAAAPSRTRKATS
jgi:hypothetical protein